MDNVTYKVFAVTWSHQWSFAMTGLYRKDEMCRYVLTKDGVRYDIPDDAIVARVAVVPEPVAVEPPPAPAPEQVLAVSEPAPEPPPPPRPPRRLPPPPVAKATEVKETKVDSRKNKKSSCKKP